MSEELVNTQDADKAEAETLSDLEAETLSDLEAEGVVGGNEDGPSNPVDQPWWRDYGPGRPT